MYEAATVYSIQQRECLVESLLVILKKERKKKKNRFLFNYDQCTKKYNVRSFSNNKAAVK